MIRRAARVAVLALLAVATACGTRLPDEAFTTDTTVVGQAASGVGGPSATGGSGSTGTTVAGGATTGGAGGSTPAAGGAQPGGAPGDGGGSVDASSAEAAAGPNQASDVGVTETTLRIGTIVAEHGVLGDTFSPAVTGLRSWVEYINASGGIAGRTLELATCDDREDRARTLECARQLVESDGVFALIATNTRAMGGAAEYLQQQGVPVLGIPINNAFYRYSHFFSLYGSPYSRDGSAVGVNGQLASPTTPYRWFRENFDATKAAVFSYDIAESAQAGDAFQAALEAEGFSVSRYVVSFAAPSFDAAVADMQRKGIEIIFDAMDGGANARLCDAMARRQFTVKAKVSTVVSMSASFGEQFNDACRPVSFIPTDSVPFTDTSNRFVAAYQDGMARYQRGRPLHQWGLEAWIAGSILQDALVAMGPTPTRAGFEAHLMGYQSNDVGGLMTPTIQWVPTDLSAPAVHDCIGINRWDDGAGGWVSATPFPYCIDDAKLTFTAAAEQGN